MPVSPPPVWCLCGHADTDHRAAGPCRESDDDGRPCGCPSIDPDEE